MADTQTRARHSASKRHSFGSSRKSVAIMIAAFRGWRRAVARRRALADLTPGQLNDIGHPEAHRPVLDIKAGLITNLMSLR
ncbi:DUF1127 domain-containing protein [Mesorhizobium sp.]|uniref:DUF1127 domain-containing protein n=2 Tax=Mesorhizobium sp. TaxID=1871066 RepID=UPI000FE9EC64|nr:MAG: DUF1127 domain-containing protein [Mesorhizobium sp.]RWK68623.1 MAG: DUF1127 domain-containing protein [Mesorhizobium sp.]RWK75438.1 MAG: DUF1127 domain-containing protein [Mesorhizobium sp.]RWK83629.1 MAG: DUF1127 domain-containing protein [Mesorhizobium sp.]RWL06285.1 MAG: DUF1127 domain-containing protein [Mesorhizobium sp.]